MSPAGVGPDISAKRQIPFRPRARLVSILGEHLISDQAVGLVELVKNSYDADATEVEIELLDLATPETTTVIIHDNGFGMTLEDIEGKWLSPAVDYKERNKQANQRTPLGRLPIGEKGVGRFAVQQIGRKLQLVTRPKGGPEIILPIDWDQFESGDAYLDDITVTVEQRQPQIFQGDTTGTVLKIQHARAPWTRQMLEKVHRTLRRLQNPLKEERARFHVILKCPEFREFENINSTDILDKAHYGFRALVDADGQCDFEYDCRHPALPPRNKSGTENLVAFAAKELQGPHPQCGPFWMNLYVWDRTRDYLVKAGISSRELNAQCGVSLFRDDLRVLPYGEPGDDWLLLDQERIQDPSGRLGNNQVIGLIQVLQEKTLQLKDKTNREGLIENEAFLDLKAMARAAIRLFTIYWRKDRPRDESPRAQNKGSLEAAKEMANALKSTVRDDVSVEIPPSLAPADSTQNHSTSQADESESKPTVTQREAVDMIIDNIDGAVATARDREKRIERLLTLAATGLAAERVVHEFGRQVAAATDALTKLARTTRRNASIADAVHVVEMCLGTLRSEFRVLAPYESISGTQATREFSIREAAELALMLNKRFLDEHGIKASVEGRDFRIRGRIASVVQIFDNLVHNACYWLGSLPPGLPKQLGLVIDDVRRRLLVADSGPGIQKEAQEHLFQPFFSLKAGGTGLGLYISNEIIRRMSGTITVSEGGHVDGAPSWATGAVFVVNFSMPTTDNRRVRNG